MTLSGYITLKMHTSITDLQLITKEGARNALWKLPSHPTLMCFL